MILLENIRFHPGEEKNDSEFAQQLAGLGDVFCNDHHIGNDGWSL